MTPTQPEHIPHRGSDVEAYIKAARDEYSRASESGVFGYNALDDLLDDYRLRADTGRPLLGDRLQPDETVTGRNEYEALLQEGVEAFRLTMEYLNPRHLPARTGWSWYDWCEAVAPGAVESWSVYQPTIPRPDPDLADDDLVTSDAGDAYGQGLIDSFDNEQLASLRQAAQDLATHKGLTLDEAMALIENPFLALTDLDEGGLEFTDEALEERDREYTQLDARDFEAAIAQRLRQVEASVHYLKRRLQEHIDHRRSTS